MRVRRSRLRPSATLTLSDTPAPASCAWCDEPSVTEVVIVPGRKNKRYAPVCAAHADGFEARGKVTLRQEREHLTQREQESADYLKRTMPWLNKKS